jgi:hypothetical protein
MSHDAVGYGMHALFLPYLDHDNGIIERRFNYIG